MKRRFGQFFLFIGIILLILFFFMDRGQNPRPAFFLIGLAGSIIGFLMIWQTRTPPAPADRFRTVRKILQKKK